MSVKIGSARIDERGKARGGRAGNQNGREVSSQNWYKHEKGWVVLRPTDPAQAEKIALAMERAIANPHIGYDQGQRLTLYNAAAKVGFDPGRVTTDVECDCSSLVRVCLAYAGIMTPNFTTRNEAKTLLATGRFRELTGKEYADRCDYLQRGDVLVTRTQGHTVVVLSDGLLADSRDDDMEKPAQDDAAPAGPGQAADWRVTRGTYWLRKKPSLAGAKIAAVPSGSHVRVYGAVGSWLAVRVRETGQKGYISQKALR